MGAMINGEGLVNVYKGTGKILMQPVANGNMLNQELINQLK